MTPGISVRTAFQTAIVVHESPIRGFGDAGQELRSVDATIDLDQRLGSLSTFQEARDIRQGWCILVH